MTSFKFKGHVPVFHLLLQTSVLLNFYLIGEAPSQQGKFILLDILALSSRANNLANFDLWTT